MYVSEDRNIFMQKENVSEDRNIFMQKDNVSEWG